MSHIVKKHQPGGLKLPGMISVDKNVSSGIAPTEKLKTLVTFPTRSVVEIVITEKNVDAVAHTVDGSNSIISKISKLKSYTKQLAPAMFVIFDEKKTPEGDVYCLLVTYLPDTLQPRQKMLFASSKGSVKKAITDSNASCIIEEYHCSELKELSGEAYSKRHAAAKPLSDVEKQMLEMEEMETAGGYSFLARMKELETSGGGTALALPGFGIGMKPSEIKKNKSRQDNIVKHKEEERIQRIHNYVANHEKPDTETSHAVGKPQVNEHVSVAPSVSVTAKKVLDDSDEVESKGSGTSNSRSETSSKASEKGEVKPKSVAADQILKPIEKTEVQPKVAVTKPVLKPAERTEIKPKAVMVEPALKHVEKTEAKPKAVEGNADLLNHSIDKFPLKLKPVEKVEEKATVSAVAEVKAKVTPKTDNKSKFLEKQDPKPKVTAVMEVKPKVAEKPEAKAKLTEGNEPSTSAFVERLKEKAKETKNGADESKSLQRLNDSKVEKSVEIGTDDMKSRIARYKNQAAHLKEVGTVEHPNKTENNNSAAKIKIPTLNDNQF